MKTFKSLKEKHRIEREHYKQDFSIRIHRALSWLNKAEQEQDTDSKFIFLWISLNSAYSIHIHEYKNTGDESLRSNFFNLLLKYGNDQIHQLIWERFSDEVRGILNNEFILNFFWENELNDDDWKGKLEKEKKEVHKALIDKNDTSYILSILFKRLYVLRNQMFHGGATWNGQLNRKQVNDGAHLMQHLVPLFIEIMMQNPSEDWGELAYPPRTDD